MASTGMKAGLRKALNESLTFLRVRVGSEKMSERKDIVVATS
jgi:hypothetical protein